MYSLLSNDVLDLAVDHPYVVVDLDLKTENTPLEGYRISHAYSSSQLLKIMVMTMIKRQQ